MSLRPLLLALGVGSLLLATVATAARMTGGFASSVAGPAASLATLAGLAAFAVLLASAGRALGVWLATKTGVRSW